MQNFRRTVVVMLVGVALVTLGCEDKEVATLETEPIQAQPTTPNSPQMNQPTQPPSSSAPALACAWAEVLEYVPDPKIVTDPDFLRRISETSLPWRVKDKASSIEMLLVPPGKFVMGMSLGEDDRIMKYDEKPAHEVTITKPFYLGRTEVTQSQWMKVMEITIGVDVGLIASLMSNGFTKQEAQKHAEAFPARSVSWYDCHRFCAKVGMNIPTEAQWEYACRAGVRQPRYERLEQIAWFADNSFAKPHLVAQKKPNALGFYDMLGNVCERCEDWYDSDYYEACEDGVVDPSGPGTGKDRVLRGGAWDDSEFYVRCSARRYSTPDDGNINVGFRVARSP
jgi:formylglycine-generating enzyme required for sulfatase activity